ncbi:hypothetical protein AHAS_Ahas07G0082100 [Arachis hypogaea]
MEALNNSIPSASFSRIKAPIPVKYASEEDQIADNETEEFEAWEQEDQFLISWFFALINSSFTNQIIDYYMSRIKKVTNSISALGAPLTSEEFVETPSGSLFRVWLCDLPDLPKLERFCNGNIALKFPLVDKFSLIDCQKMESFCASAVNVNRWTEVEFEEDKDPVLLEVDLNSAIWKAFEGMVSIVFLSL